MRLPQWNPDQAGTRTVIGAAVVVAIVLTLAVIYLPSLWQPNANAGFGPEWDCVPTKGGPVCVKKIGRSIGADLDAKASDCCRSLQN